MSNPLNRTLKPGEKFSVVAPRVPGATPSVVAECGTIEEARAAARDFSRGRRDLRGADVRINMPDGRLVERAGVGS